MLGALQKDGTLSDTGKKMAMFPLSPVLSKALIFSKKYKCSFEVRYLIYLLLTHLKVLIIIAMLSVENIIAMPSTSSDDTDNNSNTSSNSVLHAQQTLAGLFSPFGDHIMLLRVFQSFKGTCVARGIG